MYRAKRFLKMKSVLHCDTLKDAAPYFVNTPQQKHTVAVELGDSAAPEKVESQIPSDLTASTGLASHQLLPKSFPAEFAFPAADCDGCDGVADEGRHGAADAHQVVDADEHSEGGDRDRNARSFPLMISTCGLWHRVGISHHEGRQCCYQA